MLGHLELTLHHGDDAAQQRRMGLMASKSCRISLRKLLSAQQVQHRSSLTTWFCQQILFENLTKSCS